MLQPPSPHPPNSIVVKIIEPPHDPTGIADVLIGSLGLTGAMFLLAFLLGLVLAGGLFLARWERGL